MPGYFQDCLFTCLRRGKPNKKIKITSIKNNKNSELNIFLHTINTCKAQ